MHPYALGFSVIFKLVLNSKHFNFDQDGINNGSPIYSWYVGED